MMRMWQGASGWAQHDGIVSPAYVLAPKNGIDLHLRFLLVQIASQDVRFLDLVIWPHE